MTENIVEKEIIRAQVVSDLHLEFGGIFEEVEELIPVLGNTLILPGDIGIVGRGNFIDFFTWASKNFEHVIYVPGNHEFWHHEYENCLVEMREKLSQFKNVHLLYRNSITLGGIKFLGTTLWTYPPNEKRSGMVYYMYNDYKYIKKKGDSVISKLTLEDEFLTIYDTMKFHKEDLEWLDEEIEKSRKENEVCYVITHHVPLLGLKFLMENERKEEKRNVWYGNMTDESEFIIRNMDVVKAWFFGHTHFSNQCSFGKSDLVKEIKEEDNEERIWLISNQVGYKMNSGRKLGKYNKNLVFDFPLHENPKKEASSEENDGDDFEVWGEVIVKEEPVEDEKKEIVEKDDDGKMKKNKKKKGGCHVM